jgi:TM2 domain-containing membrane protein YozV
VYSVKKPIFYLGVRLIFVKIWRIGANKFVFSRIIDGIIMKNRFVVGVILIAIKTDCFFTPVFVCPPDQIPVSRERIHYLLILNEFFHSLQDIIGIRGKKLSELLFHISILAYFDVK